MAPVPRPPILRSCTPHKFPPYQKTARRVPPPHESARSRPSFPPPAPGQNSVPCSPGPIPILPNYFFQVCAFPLFLSLTAALIPRIRACTADPVARSFRFIAYSSCRLKKCCYQRSETAILGQGRKKPIHEKLQPIPYSNAKSHS